MVVQLALAHDHHDDAAHDALCECFDVGDGMVCALGTMGICFCEMMLQSRTAVQLNTATLQ